MATLTTIEKINGLAREIREGVESLVQGPLTADQFYLALKDNLELLKKFNELSGFEAQNQFGKRVKGLNCLDLPSTPSLSGSDLKNIMKATIALDTRIQEKNLTPSEELKNLQYTTAPALKEALQGSIKEFNNMIGKQKSRNLSVANSGSQPYASPLDLDLGGRGTSEKTTYEQKGTHTERTIHVNPAKEKHHQQNKSSGLASGISDSVLEEASNISNSIARLVQAHYDSKQRQGAGVTIGPEGIKVTKEGPRIG